MKEMMMSILIALLFSPMGVAAMVNREPKDQAVSIEPNRALGHAETIRGALMALISEQRLIVLKNSDGVAYNFKVLPTTEIEIEGTKGTFEDLDALVNANLSITFVPTQNGNMARKIEARK